MGKALTEFQEAKPFFLEIHVYSKSFSVRGVKDSSFKLQTSRV